MKCLIAFAMLGLVFSAPTKMQLTGIFAEVDTNGDGDIDMTEFQAVVDKFDADGNKLVSGMEFATVFVSKGLVANSDQAIVLFAKIDGNHDGNLEKAETDKLFMDTDLNNNDLVDAVEFMGLFAKIQMEVQRASEAKVVLTKLFTELDKDMSKTISGPELLALFAEGDANGDGQVTEDEFVTAWSAKTGEAANRSRALFGLIGTGDDNQLGTEDEKDAFFNVFDQDGNKEIDLKEYFNAWIGIGSQLPAPVDENVIGY